MGGGGGGGKLSKSISLPLLIVDPLAPSFDRELPFSFVDKLMPPFDDWMDGVVLPIFV